MHRQNRRVLLCPLNSTRPPFRSPRYIREASLRPRPSKQTARVLQESLSLPFSLPICDGRFRAHIAVVKVPGPQSAEAHIREPGYMELLLKAGAETIVNARDVEAVLGQHPPEAVTNIH